MIQIVKTTNGRFLIGEGGKVKVGYRLKLPFEIKKTNEGINISPYDVEMLNTYIPFIDFASEDMEYHVTPDEGFGEFYVTQSSKYLKEYKEAQKTEKENKIK